MRKFLLLLLTIGLTVGHQAFRNIPSSSVVDPHHLDGVRLTTLMRTRIQILASQ
jgi:hypothetical protein